jgi:ABC-type lipoprotein export system ATPase subunit
MPRIELVIEGPVSTSARAKQVSSMFDAPPQKKCRLEWSIDFPIEAESWSVGLVVGPSGSGKSSVMRHVWGEPPKLSWSGAGVVDDFPSDIPLEQIAAVCQAVGFNTIPAWMRPFAVLSNGEQFRADLARRLLTDADPIVVDEFTSVVDRQVAQIGSHAVQKFVRKNAKRFVAVTCHYDVIDWLQPDWVLDMATRQFSRRLLQRRPQLECTIGRLPRSAWKMFAPYHYLSADLHAGAKCYGLWAGETLASFAALLPLPVSSGRRKGETIARVSRLVTLPDWQGLGLAMVLCDALGADHVAAGKRLRMYPAHPALVRSFDRSKNWALKKAPGQFSSLSSDGTMGGRPCAVFEYCGPTATKARLL